MAKERTNVCVVSTERTPENARSFRSTLALAGSISTVVIGVLCGAPPSAGAEEYPKVAGYLFSGKNINEAYCSLSVASLGGDTDVLTSDHCKNGGDGPNDLYFGFGGVPAGLRELPVLKPTPLTNAQLDGKTVCAFGRPYKVGSAPGEKAPHLKFCGIAHDESGPMAANNPRQGKVQIHYDQMCIDVKWEDALSVWRLTNRLPDKNLFGGWSGGAVTLASVGEDRPWISSGAESAGHSDQLAGTVSASETILYRNYVTGRLMLDPDYWGRLCFTGPDGIHALEEKVRWEKLQAAQAPQKKKF